MLIFAYVIFVVKLKINVMASLNQIASELVHSVGQPNNFALRENVKAAIVHTRNELIRHSMAQHGYIDSVLQQRYKVSLVSIGDGDVEYPKDFPECCKNYVKRTKQKVPRPVRFTNNLPFTRVSNVGYKFNVEIPYIKETSAQFRRWLPGMRGCVCYDYINDYIYIFPTEQLPVSPIENIDSIIIESVFEHPTEVKIKSGEGAEYNFLNDDDEWFIPEDMIEQLKDIIIKRNLINNHRETDEIPNVVKVN